MFNQIETQGTLTKTLVDDYLLTWFEAFLIDRKARGLAQGTLRFYRIKLKLFNDFCETQVVTQIGQITPTFLRQYLLYLEDTDHNAGGRHAAYRTIRAFLYWYEDEVEPEGWKNPINKVKTPRLPDEPLNPNHISDISRLVDICEKDTFTGRRDRAILLCLLDTGTRAQEFLDILLEDISPTKGVILIRQGKDRKPRWFTWAESAAVQSELTSGTDLMTLFGCGYERIGLDL